MSRILGHGLKRLVALACLLCLAPGCQTSGLFSRDPQPTSYLDEAPPDLKGEPPSGVRHASATEPIAPESGRTASGTVLPPAGLDPDTKEESSFEWSDLSPSSVTAKVKDMAGYGPDESVARKFYAEGETLYRQERFEDAVDKFETAAARWPGSQLEEDSLFMLGESYFFVDEYPKAKTSYDKLLADYDYTSHLDTVMKRMYAMGRYWEQLDWAGETSPVLVNMTDSSQPTMDTYGHAEKCWKAIQLHDPTGPLADHSLMAIANANFKRGRFEEAAYNYDLLRREYPKSSHQLNAHRLGAESRMLMYKGSTYDGGPLDAADKVVDQTLLQFHTELGDERERLVQAKNSIVEERAERDLAIAEYYDRKKCYGSVRYYCHEVIDEYPHTKAAAKARKRLTEIEGLPDEPPNRFSWLTGMFKQYE
jgi:outer membrane protein assembly factor BamD (BamD/ComL family)